MNNKRLNSKFTLRRGMVYQQGCQVVYGIHGVCNVLEPEVRRIDRKNVEYYVLQPLDQPETRYYVPTQNAVAVSRMKPILTKQEVDQLLQEASKQELTWIDDEPQRKQYYKTLIVSGDRALLLGMIGLLYRHRKEQLNAGKKFHASDENFLRDAERLISGEFSVVLNMSCKDACTYVQNILDIE